MNLKTYKYVDLTFLLFIGVITEVVGSYLVNLFLPTVIPVFVASFTLFYVAIMRWGKIGIILIPIQSLVTYLCALYVIPNKTLAEGYVLLHQNYLTIIAFNISAVLLLVFKRDEKNFSSFGMRMLGYSSIYLLGVTLSSVSQMLFEQNLFMAFLRTSIDQLMCFIISIVALEILRSQGVLKDVKKSFISRKEEAKFEKDYYDSKK